MRHLCSICETPMERARGDYPFPESGLSGVVLRDIQLLKCPKCGAIDPIIPRFKHLFYFLARLVLKKESILCGEEIHFLRLHLGMNAKEFADLVGVDKSTLSRWEHDRQRISPTNDRLIRLIVYSLMKQQPLNELKRLIHIEHPEDHTCAKFIVEERDGEYHAEIA